MKTSIARKVPDFWKLQENPKEMLAWVKANTKVEWVIVTPQLARKLLIECNRKLSELSNRTMVESRHREYTRRMKEGRWLGPTGEPIILDMYNNLVEAQHRLEAIANSGKSYVILVVKGVPSEAFAVIGDGACRRTQDDYLSIFGHRFGKGSAAILKIAYSGFGIRRFGHRWSVSELTALAVKFKVGINFVLGNLKQVRYLNSVQIKAVIVRAYHALPQQRAGIKRFYEVLITGLSDSNKPAEKTIHVLREWLLLQKGGRGGPNRGQTSIEAKDVYSRVSRHLHSYLSGIELKQCLRASYELFPLPEEIQAKRCENTKRWLVTVATGKKAFLADFRASLVTLPKERFFRKLATDDKVCFCLGTDGVVADAVVQSCRVGGTACGLSLKQKREFAPVRITQELCRSMEICKHGYNPLAASSLLSQGLRPMSHADFDLLTGMSKTRAVTTP